jgi:hypothetical protein
MSSLPFSISPDAAAWIAEKVLTGQNDPDFASLLPGLYFCLDEQYRDEKDRVFEWCPYPFFDIGWEHPENAPAGGYVEIEMQGVKTFSPPDTLERLEGKQLILETVEVGYPTPADVKRQLLRAVPEEA